MAEEEQKRASPIERLFLKVSPSLKYWGFRVASKASGTVPLKISYGIASLVGDFIYYTWHDHSSNAISNMRRVLGPGTTLPQAKHAARESFRNYAKSLLDFIRFPYVQPTEIVARVQSSGWEILEEARSGGKGVLALSGHIGNWDFAGAVLGFHKLPLYAIADALEPPRLNDLVLQTRERNGIHILPIGTAALRSMLQALKRNDVVLLLMDRPMGADEGIAVQFFGEEAYLPSGPASIAIKSGAALVTGALMRLPGDIKFSGAFVPIPYKHLITGNKELDVKVITQEIATALERVIAHNPDQWYMFRQMWPRVDVSRRAARQERAEIQAEGQPQYYATGRNGASAEGRGGLRRMRDRLVRRRGRMDIAAMGISVDPPEMESWARGNYAHEDQPVSRDGQRKRGVLSRFFLRRTRRKAGRRNAAAQADSSDKTVVK